MVFTAAVVFGLFSMGRLPVTLMPELTYPSLTVRTEYPGAAPEEIENEISRPIEEALGVIGGLSRVTSVSRAGLSDVTLEFLWGTDMGIAAQETLERLDLVFLPREAERPLILRFDPALDPIMELSLSGAGPGFAGEAGLRRLRRIADLQVKRALEPIPGVAAVRVRGGLEEEYHVLIRKDALSRTGLSIQTVIDRLRQENINVAGGTLKEGRIEYMVRALNEYTDLAEVGETVVARVNDREIRIKDLGTVLRSHREREILTRTQGAESVQIDIYKEADANIVAVAHAVARAVGELPDADRPAAAARPAGDRMNLAERLHRTEGATLRIVADRSGFIENSIREVRNAVLVGGLLAIVVLYLFLGEPRTTAIIGVSIPVSVLVSFAPLHLMGVSLNIMSLGGLALGIGMLVDNSIVVLESIFRCREEGDSLAAAAIRGTAEVRGAVVASTLTTVAVFLPMIFVQGVAGQTFGDLSIAVVTSLLASLAVALWLIPMLASRTAPAVDPRGMTPRRGLSSWRRFRADLAGAPRGRRVVMLPWFALCMVVGVTLELIGLVIAGVLMVLLGLVAGVLRPLARWIGRTLLAPPARVVSSACQRLQESYPAFVHRLLARPSGVLALASVCALSTWWMASRLRTEFIPEVHQGEFTLEVDLPVGTPLEETVATLTPVENAILASLDEIESVLVTFGYDVTNIKRSDEGEHTARFKIVLRDSPDPAATEQRVLERLRARFTDVPDAQVRLVRPVLFTTERPVVVEIRTDELPRLKSLSDEVHAALQNLPQLADVETTLRRGAPEIQVTYHRDRLAHYGLSLGTVARQVRDMVKGFEATRFTLKDRRIPVVVRLAEEDRAQVEDIGRLTVNPGGDHPIPLAAVADLQVGEGPSEIRRIDGQRVAVIQGSLGNASLGAAVQAIREQLQTRFSWPPEATYAIRGQNEEWERSRGSLWLALGLSLFLVYVIMAAQFESLAQPLIIMASIPLAFFGSVAGLFLTGTPVSVMVFLGLIILAGVVVNNAIVLVDCANQLRARGLPLAGAIAAAGRIRLRPILLTTATTVLGLLPMALGLGEGSEIRTPLARTIIFGLITSTLLTLVVIPLMYHLAENARERLLRAAPLPDALPGR